MMNTHYTNTRNPVDFPKEQAMTDVILNTNGKGLWTNEKRAVRIVDIQLGEGYEWEPNDISGELRVYFDRNTWQVQQDGLIYTDPKFLRELRAFLAAHGLPGKDVWYSEQGAQGVDYVSLDAGTKFYKAWSNKFGIALNELAVPF